MPSDSNHPNPPTDSNQRRIVREARPADKEQIKRILDEANLTPFESSDPQSAAANQTSSNHVHICEVNGDVLAVLQWRQVGPEAEIFDIAVDGGHRRQGFASFLLDAVLNTAKSQGAKEIYLEVRDSNGAALSLYEKFGFSVTGRRSNYYRDPTEAALLLRLEFTG
jgi:ribosomal-protein-alanine acetyltransferase